METSLYGYSGKILWIDLSKNKITSKPLRKETVLRYIGGKGLGAKIMYDEVPAGISPFDPSNPIILATGPVNGFVLSGAAKFCAVFKSPLTEAWGESQCGGYFAPQMKYAGYDAIVIVGRAKRPSYILVEDEDVKIMDATHLWGMDALETEEAIKKDQGKRFQVLSIGPAGENLVRFACINHAGGRQLGRCGAGAVMGSKKLKAVAVQGSGTVEAARPEAFEEFRRWLNEEVKEKLKVLRELGTSAIMAATYSTKTLPTRNWTEGTFEGFERINAEAVMRFVKRSKACYGCLVACGKISRIDSGPYAGTEVEGPEYETLFALGSLCGIDYLESIIKANELCDRLGLDTISAGNVIAFSMECYEKGILTDKDTGGIKLEFGNHAAVLTMLEKIAYRQGIGDVLAEGVKKASKIIGKGAEKFAVHVKGLEPPGYDPRGL
ncbi:aldehyde ferredoxin oxidoreductase, partial [Candidatus Bathyarchaeota archaeon]